MHSVQEALVMKVELLPVEEMPLQSLRLSLRSLAVVASPWLAKALRPRRLATPSLPYPTNAICQASLLFQWMSGPRAICSLAGPAILDHSLWRGVAFASQRYGRFLQHLPKESLTFGQSSFSQAPTLDVS